MHMASEGGKGGRSGPTTGQRRLMYYLFVVAALVFSLGIAAVWALSAGPLS
jgi:hypothetical protein